MCVQISEGREERMWPFWRTRPTSHEAYLFHVRRFNGKEGWFKHVVHNFFSIVSLERKDNLSIFTIRYWIDSLCLRKILDSWLQLV